MGTVASSGCSMKGEPKEHTESRWGRPILGRPLPLAAPVYPSVKWGQGSKPTLTSLHPSQCPSPQAPRGFTEAIEATELPVAVLSQCQGTCVSLSLHHAQPGLPLCLHWSFLEQRLLVDGKAWATRLAVGDKVIAGTQLLQHSRGHGGSRSLGDSAGTDGLQSLPGGTCARRTHESALWVTFQPREGKLGKHQTVVCERNLLSTAARGFISFSHQQTLLSCLTSLRHAFSDPFTTASHCLPHGHHSLLLILLCLLALLHKHFSFLFLFCFV